MRIITVVSFMLAGIASASYISVFNTCRSTGINLYMNNANDEGEASLVASLPWTGVFSTEELNYSPAYYWLYDSDDNFIANGNFTFPSFGANALGYIAAANSTCIPQKIELEYTAKSSIVYINSLGVADQYVFFDGNMEGEVQTQDPFTSLVTSYDGNFAIKDADVKFCDTPADDFACTSTGHGDMKIPAGDAVFFVVYVPSSAPSLSDRSILWFTATGTISGDLWNDDFLDDDVSLSDGAIAGIVIGVLAGVGLIGFTIYYCTCRKKKNVDDTVALHGAM